ncbi:hypothetical protein WA026_019044 [Henosepilachna vigintioctopunctata]|uniref:Uncharacterized protein n=1 Tax=Henosepilachna vigintioctopunctata TaxID=420089 RepID=A0AAW1VEX9_9CUCU
MPSKPIMFVIASSPFVPWYQRSQSLANNYLEDLRSLKSATKQNYEKVLLSKISHRQLESLASGFRNKYEIALGIEFRFEKHRRVFPLLLTSHSHRAHEFILIMFKNH